MAFLGVYKAIYDYAPAAEGELQINEGDLLYVLEKSDEDDWWKAKKKATAEEEDEPVGLIPNTYIEEVSLIGTTLVPSLLVVEQLLTVDITGTSNRTGPRPLRVHETDG